MLNIDTIVAQATPAGRGGVGIVRLSGPLVSEFARAFVGVELMPRHATFCNFVDVNGEVLDQGIALYFKAPHSFTGEDVLELQGHGGPMVIDSLIERALSLGARLARPGEFSERAFLNDKLDLVQAEAIADLIDAQSKQAAQSALRSLQGEFSTCIHRLLQSLIHIRSYIEAALDFPDEDIDLLEAGQISEQLDTLLQELDAVFKSAEQGAILRDGMTIVIAGKPNAGKSSLLNALSGKDAAIVTEIAGTTRDVLREQIQIDGMPLHIIDTAGLRETEDLIELQGIKRAWQALEEADAVLLVVDSNIHDTDLAQTYANLFALNKPIILVQNKIDQSGHSVERKHTGQVEQVFVSAKTGIGLDLLRQSLKDIMGFQAHIETNFIARRRHLAALKRAQTSCLRAKEQLSNRALELLAEELRAAQTALNEITGEFSSDDLLGEIFSSFCIGK